MAFQIHALPAAAFVHLSGMDATTREVQLVRRIEADSSPGFPCRVSLEDAQVGETVHLLHYVHQDAASPFRASHAIYVREGVAEARPNAGEVPLMIRRRMISLRAFGTDGMMRDADLATGDDVAPCIERMFGDSETAYLHLHFAKQGCFAARVTRT